jgi:hypothetical protein
MSYDYNGFVAAVANLAGTAPTNPYLAIELPSAIEYAEQKIFRDLDLIANIFVDVSQTTVPSNRSILLPGNIIAVNSVAATVPAGTTLATGGSISPLMPISHDTLDFIYPDASFLAVPKFYNYLNQGYGSNSGTLQLGPWPDAAYNMRIQATQRPVPLSATNPITFLTTNLPDLFLIAAMIHVAGYQKNWSAIGNDPGSALTWETQYHTLLAGASAEELRKRYEGSTVIPPRGKDIMPTTPEAR